MRTVKKKADVAKYYQDEKEAQSYIDIRYTNPMGLLVHTKQAVLINQIIKEYKTKSLLEIACGPGRLTADIRPTQYALATDFSKPMLAIAKKRSNKKWSFKIADAFNLKLTKKFDTIFSFKLIRHFEREERLKIYKQIYKTLAKDGILILDVPTKLVNTVVNYVSRSRHGEKVYDASFTKKEITEELAEAGFTVEAFHPVCTHFYIQYTISAITTVFKMPETGLKLLRTIEKIWGVPWEWIVVAKKN